MTMTKTVPFHYQLDYSQVPPEEDLDSRGNKVTTIKCHGKIILETKDQIREIFKSTPFQGSIIFDLSDVDYMDSAGLGALLSLKLLAAKRGGVSVSYRHMTARILQLLKIANLTEWFTSCAGTAKIHCQDAGSDP